MFTCLCQTTGLGSIPPTPTISHNREDEYLNPPEDTTSQQSTNPPHADKGEGDGKKLLRSLVLYSHDVVTVTKVDNINHDHVCHNPDMGCGLPSPEGKRPGCTHSFGSVGGGDVTHVSLVIVGNIHRVSSVGVYYGSQSGVTAIPLNQRVKTKPKSCGPVTTNKNVTVGGEIYSIEGSPFVGFAIDLQPSSYS